MRYFCHDHPEILSLETEIIDAAPGRVRLKDSPLYPGGGGQLPDRGIHLLVNVFVKMRG